MEVSANKIRFSVLDQSPIREGGTAADAIRETVELAQRVESLGYHRYWLAEHHGTDGLAGPAPEIMVTRVAAATREMRVGSGGVMLSHYSPYKVAENFKVLERHCCEFLHGRFHLTYLGMSPCASPTCGALHSQP